MTAGKFTERRQYGAGLFKHKTRQSQPVARWALQLHDWMGVASQHGVGDVLLRMMAGRERAD